MLYKLSEEMVVSQNQGVGIGDRALPNPIETVNTEEREKAFRYDNHVLSLGH
jgi:hypothetical protein